MTWNEECPPPSSRTTECRGRRRIKEMSIWKYDCIISRMKLQEPPPVTRSPSPSARSSVRGVWRGPAGFRPKKTFEMNWIPWEKTCHALVICVFCLIQLANLTLEVPKRASFFADFLPRRENGIRAHFCIKSPFLIVFPSEIEYTFLKFGLLPAVPMPGRISFVRPTALDWDIEKARKMANWYLLILCPIESFFCGRIFVG